ncbi:hypothetical protein N480_12710 [Pseudoalteromonas luteoviolacea S2607]|uniref:hypothetical protein n=1 Tax=Pseudoalteromonas luteoviolacea TaxID=43657 RepID=UPI0007B04AE3|nr:hypothetical protein [Pseudoalteromonas luteoviolacea]KZN38508.1 hypothetical protein N480_12710 [Pseudoalteromonas luteoviolacea S2607]
MKKTCTILLGLISAASFSASAHYAFTASKYNIEVGESTTLDWQNYATGKFPDPTFNLYVTKPNGEDRFAFRRGYKQRSFTRLINMSGEHLFELEICDSNGQNCYLSPYAKVRIKVDHGCQKKSSHDRGWYECNGRQVTQYTYTNWTGAADSISEFQVIDNRLTWKFSDRSESTSAYFTACKNNGSYSQITQLENYGIGFQTRVSNFIAKKSGYATWTFWNEFRNETTSHNEYLGVCY